MLAGFLNDYLNINPLPGDVLVPIPVHKSRLKERGYNQSSLLAGELGKLRHIPVTTDCLVRKTHSSPQARTATAAERKENVINAFACADSRLAGKQVILIDDVSTSGATLNAGARALKASGVKTVWGLTLALEL
jgi:ComF family protein